METILSDIDFNHLLSNKKVEDERTSFWLYDSFGAVALIHNNQEILSYYRCTGREVVILSITPEQANRIGINI